MARASLCGPYEEAHVIEWLAGDGLPWVYAIGLLILGFVLILLEIFVIPGMNIFGLLGFGTVCIGVLFAYRRLGPESAAIIGTLGIAGTAALVWLLVNNKAWHRMVRTEATDTASGFTSAPIGLAQRLGETGKATTPLRPSGRGQFGEDILDVVTQGSFHESGVRLEIIEIHGNRIVVEAVDGSPDEAADEPPKEHDTPSVPAGTESPAATDSPAREGE